MIGVVNKLKQVAEQASPDVFIQESNTAMIEAVIKGENSVDQVITMVEELKQYGYNPLTQLLVVKGYEKTSKFVR